MQDLGWHNAGGDVARIIDEHLKKCRALGHYRDDIDVGPQYRGIEHVVTCIPCDFVYRYDSSD